MHIYEKDCFTEFEGLRLEEFELIIVYILKFCLTMLYTQPAVITTLGIYNFFPFWWVFPATQVKNKLSILDITVQKFLPTLYPPLNVYT